MDKQLFVEVFKDDMRDTFVPVCAFLLILASIVSIPFMTGFGAGFTIAVVLYIGAIVFAFLWTVVGAFGSYRREKVLQK